MGKVVWIDGHELKPGEWLKVRPARSVIVTGSVIDGCELEVAGDASATVVRYKTPEQIGTLFTSGCSEA